MPETELKKQGRRALREIKFSLLFGALALLIGVAVYRFGPQVDSSIFHSEVGHTRNFRPTDRGGIVEYREKAGQTGNTDRLRKDLGILCQRFSRGQFVMTRLAGFSKKDVVRSMESQTGKISCRLAPEGAVLEIEAGDNTARKALHEYLAFLQKYWTNQTPAAISPAG
ncbi:MAG: hypothetical protein HS115_12895 [Spirochaetales bacterium]|nr:hypothetical protein [Spirochaetales bacterium]